MSEDSRFEIPKEMRSMAEASFEQARQTFEKFLSSAHQAAGSFEERGANARTNAKEIGSKAVARLRAVAAQGQGSDRGDAAAQRVCAGSDAFAGGTGQRNGLDRQPRRDGCGEAENLGFRAAILTKPAMPMKATLECCSITRTQSEWVKSYMQLIWHCTQNCFALHKFDML